jgi:transglutaminase-like putative cysteine protease
MSGQATAPDTRALLWVVAAFAGALLLHVDRLPVWCLLAVGAPCAWRVLAAYGRVPLPHAAVRLGIGALLLFAVIAQFDTLTGLAAGTALLACMGALKLLETRARRDRFIVVGVTLFLIIAACLERQSLPRAALYALEIWLTCAALLVAAHPAAGLDLRQALRGSARALGFALPLTLLFFLLFPRVQGQLWGLPGAESAVTGLSNEMTPGAISSLSESDEPAFRVRFAGPLPPASELYWRGPVLHQFDGYTWRNESRMLFPFVAPLYAGPRYEYRVTLEPHQHSWWFALDLPAGAPQRDVTFTFDYQLLANRPVFQATSYEVASYTRWSAAAPLGSMARRVSTQLPPQRNPRARALGRELRAQATDDAQFVSMVLAFFRSGGFAYTQEPPRLGRDSVDDFLFRTRLGFCGHFASAFVTLMRAAGVPARVVTGYQGGEWNPIGNYLIVRQSDAHAWAEVWLDARGWVRVDPTGVVAPERLTRGFLGSLPDAASQAARLLRDIGWLSRLRLGWDAVNTLWKERILDFDLRSQLALLGRLGFDDPRIAQLCWLLAAGLCVWLGVVGLRLGRLPHAQPRDELAAAWQAMSRTLAGAGWPRGSAEGPLAYRDRLRAGGDARIGQALPLIELYARLRYGAEPTATAIRGFCRQARTFRPGAAQRGRAAAAGPLQ